MKTYIARLPFDGILSVSVESPTALTDEEVIQRAADMPDRLRVDVVSDGDVELCMIEEWQIHQGPVDRGNICCFLLTQPDVELTEDDDES